MGVTIGFIDKNGVDRVMSEEEYDEYMRPHRMMWEESIWAQRIDKDFRFEVGKKYLSLEGKIITIVDAHNTNGYETVQGDDSGPNGDLGWRYNRRGDFGRCTGSQWDSPRNLIPFEIKE